MTRVRIVVASGDDIEQVDIDVPEWEDLTAEDQKLLVDEAAAPAVERFEPTVYHYELAD